MTVSGALAAGAARLVRRFAASSVRLAAAVLILGSGWPAAAAQPDDGDRPGNVVFVHPDGLGLSGYAAARAYWVGPDGALHWDHLPQIAVYRGHMTDQLTGTSNGGATVHAFGYRVAGRHSFGRDGGGRSQPGRAIRALSGFEGSLLREAGAAGYPTGLVNDGHIGEPGTAAFAAETDGRDDWNRITLQIIAGRDMAEPASRSGDTAPYVILGGGERNFLPQGARRCTAADAGSHVQDGLRTYPLDCLVHTLDWSRPGGHDGPFGIGREARAERTDGRNLLREAADMGYVVVRTRAEFEALAARVEREASFRPRVLGLFAAHHTFNDRSEEELIAAGFRGTSIPEDARGSNLVLYGAPRAGAPGFHPPRADEMTRLALRVLNRISVQRSLPYLLIVEVESTDNFANRNNAIGTLVAARIADEAIGVVREAMAGADRQPWGSPLVTSVIVAADSEAGGMNLAAVPAAAGSSGRHDEFARRVDGMYGQGTAPFAAAADQFGRVLHFGIAWAGTPDFAGGIVARAASNRVEARRSEAAAPGADVAAGQRGCTPALMSERFDNTDIYRFMYAQLFGRCLPRPAGPAPARSE